MSSDGKNTYICFGDNADVVRYVTAYYERWRDQPLELVRDIANLPIEEQCYAIFNYLLQNVRYQEDKAGYQFIKSPARLLKDRVGDCKSMTIFIAGCLHCLGISHTIRFVNFDGGTQYTHVYPIAYDERGEAIILDAVERNTNGQPVFNYARTYSRNIDIDYDK